MNPDRPYISVIIPNYNRGDLLEETLESLVNQDYQQWEGIVVDDGSTDDSEKITNGFIQKDSRFRFFKRDRNPAGAPVCRNIGISRSKGNYLIFLDSDDLLRPFALSQRAERILQEPQYDFWVFPMLLFRNDYRDARILWNIDNGKEDLHRFLVLDAPWQTSGPVWRKEAVMKIGGFTEGLACWQDVDFHLKAIIAGLKGAKFYNDSPDVLYRQHETNSISQGEISSPAKLKSRREIFMRHVTSLVPVMTPGIKLDLRLLGGNIAIGAAKVLNAGICLSVISYGFRQRIFSPSITLKLCLILLFYFLRLNRIASFDRKIKVITREYRQDTNIGKHSFIQSQGHGRIPGQ
ncbi:MAG: glycosyltransferase family 2 protein [Bacteroidota bacterium]